MNEKIDNKLLFAFSSIILFSIVLTHFLKFFTGWSLSVVLASLIVGSFFLPVYGIIFFSGISAWLLSWRPDLTVEISMLIIIPIITSFLAKAFVVGKNALLIAGAIFIGILLFYIFSLGNSIWHQIYFILSDIFVSVFWSMVVFFVFISKDKD